MIFFLRLLFLLVCFFSSLFLSTSFLNLTPPPSPSFSHWSLSNSSPFSLLLHWSLSNPSTFSQLLPLVTLRHLPFLPLVTSKLLPFLPTSPIGQFQSPSSFFSFIITLASFHTITPSPLFLPFSSSSFRSPPSCPFLFFSYLYPRSLLTSSNSSLFT